MSQLLQKKKVQRVTVYGHQRWRGQKLKQEKNSNYFQCSRLQPVREMTTVKTDSSNKVDSRIWFSFTKKIEKSEEEGRKKDGRK